MKTLQITEGFKVEVDSRIEDVEAKYIVPTKDRPVFKACCDYIGNIGGIYKDHLVGNCCSDTFGLNYKDSINGLHEWILDNKSIIEEYPKCKFDLYLIDGTIEHEQAKEVKVYSISARKAKKLLL